MSKSRVELKAAGEELDFARSEGDPEHWLPIGPASRHTQYALCSVLEESDVSRSKKTHEGRKKCGIIHFTAGKKDRLLWC